MSWFSRNLVDLRQHSGMSQVDLAKRAGCSRSAIGMYETGKREPDYETLKVFADIFGVSFNRLLGKETQRTARAPADANRMQTNTYKRSNAMAKEKSDFRDNLERIAERFPGREIIPIRQVAAFLGCDTRTLLGDPSFPRKAVGAKKKTYFVPLVGLARWLSC